MNCICITHKHKSNPTAIKKKNKNKKKKKTDGIRENILSQSIEASMRFTLLLLVCLSPYQLALGVNALKVSVSIPELVKLNDAFWLNCTHQKQQQQQQQQPNLIQTESGSGGNEEIYAIKWYKDDEEFYRYLPNAQPKVSIYETNGIQLDVSSYTKPFSTQHEMEASAAE